MDDVFAKLRTEYDALDPNDMLSKHWDKWSSLQATGDAARNCACFAKAVTVCTARLWSP